MNVEELLFKTAAAPTSNIASGVYVDEQTEISLFCVTPDATIYYTLDGSCPCDDTEGRKIYDGTPIIISQTTTIKAMAAANGLGESNVVEFNYFVGDPTGIRTKGTVPNVRLASDVRYNLNGQRVDDSYKGVVVQKGKKMIIR